MPFKLRELANDLLKPLQHPASKRTVEFLLASGAVAFAGVYITFRNHEQDMAAATRNSAVSAVSNISDLTSERRERAALVVSSIRRGAPKEEIEARKTAYDEAYVRWNSKVPGKLLEIRASLNLRYGSYFQDYIDGLTDAERLKHVVSNKRDSTVVSSKPGIINIMDSCVTQAYDAYRLAKYEDAKLALFITQQCKFTFLYNDLVICISDISRVLYDAVTGKLSYLEDVRTDSMVAASCMPPDDSIKWSESPPIKTNSLTLPATQVNSDHSKG